MQAIINEFSSVESIGQSSIFNMMPVALSNVQQYTVSNNACIWIPRGMIHVANVLSGPGYSITMRLN